MLVLRKPRTEQPQSWAGIDWSNPITQGLRLAVVPSLGMVNVVTGALGTGSPVTSTGRFGRRFRGDGTNPHSFAGQNGLDPLAGPISGHVRGSYNAAGLPAFCGLRGGGFGWATAGAGDVIRPDVILYGVVNQQATATADLFISAYGSSYSLGFSHVAATTGGLLHYAKGRQLGAAVNTGTPGAAGTTLGFLSDGAGSASVTQYDCEVLLLWSRYLSAYEHASLDENPWQVFEPQQITIPYNPTVTAYWPGSDITVTGWTGNPDNTNKYANLDETTAADADYCESPDLTTAATFGWATNLPAGTWDVKFRGLKTGTNGQVRILVKDSGGTALATGAWHAQTGAYAEYTDTLTTSAVSDRFTIEVQT